MKAKTKQEQFGFTRLSFWQNALAGKFNNPDLKSVVNHPRPEKAGVGFTLIELLVVISIIGLLASVVLVALNSARQKSRDAKRLGDINQLAKAMELYYTDASSYPTGVGAAGAATNYVCASAGCGGNIFGSAQLSSFNSQGTQYKMTPTYITTIPTAPLPSDSPCTAATNSYMYESNNGGTTYTFTFCLGARTGSFSQGIHYLNPNGLR